jgi:predicted MFS family arabinose efflux permease
LPRHRRRLITGLGLASALALAATALAASITWLVAASCAVGVLSPVPQLVAPLAVALGGGQRQGRIVGTIQSGLLVGVLASRAYSGALAEVAGWRAVYWCSAAMTLLLTIILWRALPSVPAVGAMTYRSLMSSLPRLLLSHPLIARVAVSGALVGIAFGAFWTTLTFLLEQHYHYGSAVVGLFGLVAAASALASPAAGRLADRLGQRAGLAAITAVVIAGWAILLPGGTHLLWLVAGVIVLDVGVWSNQVACQAAMFSLDPAAHSRLNTVYFTLRFLGIATGSLAGSLAWSHGGWPDVTAVGIIAASAGLIVGILPDRATAIPARTHMTAPPDSARSGSLRSAFAAAEIGSCPPAPDNRPDGVARALGCRTGKEPLSRSRPGQSPPLPVSCQPRRVAEPLAPDDSELMARQSGSRRPPEATTLVSAMGRSFRPTSRRSPEHQNGQAEYAAREQVADLEQHP